MISLDRAQSARNATDVFSICSKTRDRKDSDSKYMPLVQSGFFRVLYFVCGQFQLVLDHIQQAGHCNSACLFFQSI